MKLTKQLKYKNSIKKHLYFTKELSCADLCELLDKSFPLTHKVVAEMVEEGVVEEVGQAISTGGRRPQLYALKSNLGYIVSVAMDQMVTRIALLDMHNNYIGGIKNIKLPLNQNFDFLHKLTDELKKFITEIGIHKSKIIGVGIGMPGFVDIDKGLNYSYLSLENEGSIVDYIENRIQLPVYIDNDSSLIALAELKFGEAKNKQNTMVVNIGWGIGLGMIINGELYNGCNGFAGELSHIPIFSNNKMCSCGKTGCLQTEASLFLVVEAAIQGLKEGKLSVLKDLNKDDIEVTSKAIMNAAANGDKFAVELLFDVGYNIGIGVATLIHLLNPELVVLSGRGSIAGKIWKTPIQQAINEHCIPRISENTSIVISSFGYEAELIGAAALVMKQFDVEKRILQK